MTREKKKAPAPAHGVAAAARRAKMERALQYTDTVWRNLNPLKAPPKMKHKSYYEAVENADKKKKLEFEITTELEPPPGFEFIPTGHPELSQECKEQSRDRDAMFFIVSNSKDTLKLDHHMNRLGYHFRHSVIEAARKALYKKGHFDQAAYIHEPGKPEPIPNSQREIDQEADAVLRDLFPRIPNTDRQEIIDHAFKKDGKFNGEIKVGMAKDITLARRVQLAALAHIRHTHTRYDQLLRESDWANARKAVEKPCLDIIVKWRGDEETGRDQLDEILREVIEISDTENDSEEEESIADNAPIYAPRTTSAAISIPNREVSRLSRVPNYQYAMDSRISSPALTGPRTPSRLRRHMTAERRTTHKTQQRFKRYAAAAEALANSSNQDGRQEGTPGLVATPIEAVRRQGSTHPVNTLPTTPSAIADETYVPRRSYGHTDIHRIPVLQNGVSQNRAAGMPNASLDAHIHGDTEQFIRVPDTQRPKVGPYSANYSHTRPLPPLSPVRLGLQDLLLPSIEPRSPDDMGVLRDTSQMVHCETRHSTDVPRVISRTVAAPTMSSPRARSPAAVINDAEVAAKRRRVITYFPEDFQRSPGSSYVRVAPRSQDDTLHRPHFEYLAEQHHMAPTVQGRAMYQDVPRAAPNQDIRETWPEVGPNRLRAHPIHGAGDDRSPTNSRAPDRGAYQTNSGVPTRQVYPVNRVEAPLRSRANPIVIDRDNSYEPRRVVEVRGSPVLGAYRAGSPRGNAVHSPHIRDLSRLIYVDESTARVRKEPGTHRLIHSGEPAYQETQRPLSFDISQQPAYRRYEPPYDENVPPVNEVERVSLARPSATSREIQAQRLERFVGLQRPSHRLHPESGFSQGSLQQQPRDHIIYREVGPDFARPAGEEYDRLPQQPFPVYPAPSSYVEIRGPPTHRRMPDRRDMIYVE
ncbi:hypothetical protein F5Y14DRAFT_299923 [Nemania sp. NC0429]|nr:hypothetical protein F5Y14DRAFT_299923 [Nemania sp. NC0429]